MRLMRRRGGARVLFAVFALLANFAGPAIAVLHGWEHAHAFHTHASHTRAHVHASPAAPTVADRRINDARASATRTVLARPTADHGAGAAIDHAAPMQVRLAVEARDHGAQDHPALHADLIAKRSVDVAAVLPARAPPTIAVVIARSDPPPVPARQNYPWQRLLPPSAQPRAPPLG